MFNIVERSNPLFKNIVGTYDSNGYSHTQVPQDLSWDTSDLGGARYVAHDIDNKAVITIYDASTYSAIYISNMPEYGGGSEDRQFLYNAIVYKSQKLKNPGFEISSGSLPLYWNRFQTGTKAIFTYPETGRTGGKSVAIKYATKETGKVALWRQQGIIVSPSKQYKLSGYMKLDGVTGGGTGGGTGRLNGASLRINWYKSDGNLIRVDLIIKSGTSGWTKYEATFTSPANAAKATVGGDLFNAAGKVWFDDLSFVKIP